MKRIVSILVCLAGFCVFGGVAEGQTVAPPVQHFVASTTAGSFGGSPVSIASLGTQLTKSVSCASEFISNPADSSKPHIGSGVCNDTFGADRILPKSLKSKLLIDPSNYNITLQAGAGVESLSNGIGVPRTKHIIGNFGIYGSYPMPGGHSQIGLGYKWILGPHGGLVKIPVGQLNFTF